MKQLIAKKTMERHRHLIHSISKTVWKLLRLVLIGIRKSISRSSYRPFLKRVKIAALSNTTGNMFHSRRRSKYPFAGPRLAYEFSCSNSPAAYPIKKWMIRRNSKVSPPSQKEFEEILARMLMGGGGGGGGNQQWQVEASPALPGFGFGRSPAVRQLRITDSPFPLNYVPENNHIDEDAEKFIAKFYRELLHQASPLVVF